MNNSELYPSGADPLLAGGRVTIDLQALAENYAVVSAKAPNAKTAAVCKANAYGLGLEPVVHTLSNVGCDTFFVALPEEGVRVKRVMPSATVFVLNGLHEPALPTYDEAGLIPVLCSMKDIALWGNYWSKRSQRKPCALHVDTGMNRLGLRVEELEALAADGEARRRITPIMIMSHLVNSGDGSDPMNAFQLAAFAKARLHYPDIDASLANSGGIFLDIDYHFDLTRPGISLYGGEALDTGTNPAKPVVTLEGRIAQLRLAKAGESVGYCGTYRFEKDSKIAIVSVGYADGYLRAAGSGNQAENPVSGAVGYIAGHRVPVVGRVSMDLSAFDVSAVPEQELAKHQWVELFGPNIAVDDVARASGTIGYELLTSLSERYTRYYRKPDEG